MSSTNWSYEEAVSKVMSLQSLRSVSEEMVREKLAGTFVEDKTVQNMEKMLQRVGILSRLDELSVIHVSGSKGKGSTCSMCESILRQHGYRTGFFSSPHLINVQERIRIDGRPLDADKFTKYSQRIYDLLRDSQENGCGKLTFPPFMAILAFYVFLEEKVDVAVIEVFIGGTHDTTNVLRKVPVVGITLLELEHVEVLGETLTEIAAAKGGIMKRGCQAYTVPQAAEAMEVLTARAEQLDCPLSVVPSFSQYTCCAGSSLQLPVDVPTYRVNASLAVQLSHAWMRIRQEDLTPSLVYEVPRQTALGLSQFRWPGRYHVVEKPYATFYVEGAHTKKSMEVCTQWFMNTSDSARDKILIFTCRPGKAVDEQFNYLVKIPFKQVYFVPPSIHKTTLQSVEETRKKHENFVKLWSTYPGSGSTANLAVLESVNDSLDCVKQQNGKPSVLLTGSLPLVGEALSIIDPECASTPSRICASA